MKKLLLFLSSLIGIMCYSQTLVTHTVTYKNISTGVSKTTTTIDTIPAVVVTVIKDSLVYVDTCLAPPHQNQPPTANAGQDKTITLPINSISVIGSGTDPDGTIVGYVWTKISGGTVTISGNSTATLTLTNLVAGVYDFKLTVIDDQGATGSDDFVLTVNPTTTTTGNVVYKNGFETSADIDPFDTEQFTNAKIITGGVSGNCIDFKVVKGQISTHGGFRDEIQLPEKYTLSNTAIVIEFDMKVVSLDNGTGLCEQDHGETTGTSGQNSMWIKAGKYQGQLNNIGTAGSSNTYGPNTLSVQLGVWVHVKQEVFYSTGTNGYLRYYIGDMSKPYWSFTGKTCDGSGQYQKLGINWFASPSSNVEIYYDNLVIQNN